MSYTRLFDIPEYQNRQFPKEDCLAGKVKGVWKKYSTREVIDHINQVSRALIAFGIRPDDKVALISTTNRPEWNFCDLGMLQIGAVNVPVYPTISESDYEFIFNDAEVKLVFVSDEGLLKKMLHIKDKVPTLQAIYTFDQTTGTHWSEFLKLGDDRTLQARVDELKVGIKPEQLATIIYTSGTTGVPKGVMLSHHNIVSNVKASLKMLPIDQTKTVLSFLPLCHIFERMVIYTYMAAGCSIYYAESMDTIAENLKEVRPHFFTSVPRLLEKVYDKIVAKGLELTGIKRKLFFWALELGLQYDEKGQNGLFYNLQLAIARKLIFSKWKEALGGRIEGIVTGAAALQMRLEKVFNAAGIKVRQGYGQTETSPVITVGKLEEGEYILGTVGQVIEGVEVKLEHREGMQPDEGEILVKGPNVMMGYYKRPDLTAQTIDKDGWLHTGDVGKFVEWNGKKFLKITDRVKELFKTSGGKYVAPQVIENKIKESPLVEQVMVVGENQKFVGALIIPSYENLKDWATKKGISYSSREELLTNKLVLDEYERQIEEFNKYFGKVEQVKKFKLLPKEWTIEGGELTPTMKVKRKVVVEKYKDVIAEIYNQ
jgi:long-chain acyl-CoA synthetase